MPLAEHHSWQVAIPCVLSGLTKYRHVPSSRLFEHASDAPTSECEGHAELPEASRTISWYSHCSVAEKLATDVADEYARRQTSPVLYQSIDAQSGSRMHAFLQSWREV